MDVETNQISKIYWTISEAALLIGENTSALRFWESRFYWLKVKKGKLGNRLYTKESLDNLINIHILIKWLGMTEWGIKQAYELGYYQDILSFAKQQKRYSENTKIEFYKVDK